MSDDFILLVDDFYTKEQCNELIELFERSSDLGLTFKRNDAAHNKADKQLFSNDIIANYDVNISHWPSFQFFTSIFWEKAYKLYSEKYSILNVLNNHTIRTTKIQKTEVGEGYHLWHCENDSPENDRRVLAFILYLNDVEQGGETEFLYYHKRVEAKQGRLVLWPAGFTHTHRGNPPLSNTKYILTGWVEFA